MHRLADQVMIFLCVKVALAFLFCGRWNLHRCIHHGL